MYNETVDNTITLSNGKSFILSPINSRSIEIETKDSFIQVSKEGRTIKSILLGGEYNISIGDNIKCKVIDTITCYNILFITQITKDLFQLSCENLTKTSLFLLPCLGGTRLSFGWDYLVNAYVSKEEQPKLHLIYRFIGSENYNTLEKFLINNKYFLKVNEKDKYLTTYIFNLPDEHLEDYHLFLNGKYSKLSEQLKQKIMCFHKLDKKSNIYRTLYKSKELKKELEMELGIKLDEESELASIPEFKTEIIC